MLQKLMKISKFQMCIATPVWQMRALLNWERQVMIKELIDDNNTAIVAQLYSSHGLDFGKWERQKIHKFYGIERDEKAAAEAQSKWSSKGSSIPARFIPFRSLIPASEGGDLEEGEQQFEELLGGVAAFNGLDETAFESQESLNRLLKIVSEMLNEGGYFFGMVVDSSEVWTRALKASPKSSFSTAKNLIHIRFDNIQQLNTAASDIDTIGMNKFIGIKYYFTTENTTSTYYLVHLPTFIRTAWRYGFQLIDMTNCAEFYDEHKTHYAEILKRSGVYLPKPKPDVKYKILPEQKEAVSLFTTFIFRKIRAKVDPLPPPPPPQHPFAPPPPVPIPPPPQPTTTHPTGTIYADDDSGEDMMIDD